MSRTEGRYLKWCIYQNDFRLEKGCSETQCLSSQGSGEPREYAQIYGNGVQVCSYCAQRSLCHCNRFFIVKLTTRYLYGFGHHRDTRRVIFVRSLSWDVGTVCLRNNMSVYICLLRLGCLLSLQPLLAAFTRRIKVCYIEGGIESVPTGDAIHAEKRRNTYVSLQRRLS